MGFAATVNRLRLRICAALDDTDEMHETALAILDQHDATEEAVLDALLALATGAPNKVPPPADIPALVGANPERRLAIALRLAASPPAAIIAAAMADRALHDLPDTYIPDESEHDNLELLLIAGGKFNMASRVASAGRAGDLALSHIFNGAVAECGRTGSRDPELFRKVIEHVQAFAAVMPSANLFQCAALSAAITGDIEMMTASIAEARRIMQRLAT